MINLLLHKDIENTVTTRPLDSILLNRPIIPRGASFHPAPCPRIAHPFYFLVVWQSILSLTSSHQESVGRWGTWFLLSLQIPFHPPSCFVPLEADINELHKSAFIDIWPQYDFSQWEAPAGYIIVGKEREVGVFISSVPFQLSRNLVEALLFC